VLDLVLRADGAHDQVRLLPPVVQHVVVDAGVDRVGDDGGGVARLLEEVPSLAAQDEDEEHAEGEYADEGDGDGQLHPETVPPGDVATVHLTHRRQPSTRSCWRPRATAPEGGFQGSS
jgi:hypothetical protein